MATTIKMTMGRVITVGVAATVAVAIGAIPTVFAAPKSSVPTPAITSQPASPTAATNATFRFTDSQANVTFRCTIDALPSSTCVSPTSYSGMADGSHSFSVQAVATGGTTSSSVSVTWTVDTQPPSVVVASPANGTTYSAAAWSSICSGGGICGSASDASGVRTVALSIRQGGGSYWSGTSFSAATETFVTATGTTSWRYAFPSRPSDGTYMVRLQATDVLGNLTTPGQYTSIGFAIDTVPPPAPAITSSPDNPTVSSDAQFSLTDSEPGVTLQCSVDGATYAVCASPVSYTKLKAADHTFQARAVDAAGNVSASVLFNWTILVQKSFLVTGMTQQLLSPGVSSPINLVFNNPYNFPIRIGSVTTTIANDTTKNGQPNPDCRGLDNLALIHDFGGSVVISSNSSSSLQVLGTPSSQWPVIKMLNLSTNQDACKGSIFQFTFSGTATKA